MNKLTFEGQVDLIVYTLIFCAEISGLIGYWKMRRWGMYFYGLGSVGGAIGLGWLFKLHPSTLQYMVSIIFIGTGLFYFKRMR